MKNLCYNNILVTGVFMGRFNNGIIFTNQKCIACNKCITNCDVFGANICVSEGKKDFIVTDSNKCTLCGTCVDCCPQNARDYHDDTNEFFDALKKGEKITVLISPTFKFHYENEVNQIIGYLKSLGADKVYDSSFGEQIDVWATTKYIKDNYDKAPDERAFIANTCPSIINKIEKYHHGLIRKIIPVQPPVNCCKIYLNKYLNDSNKIAYICPCIAQKLETKNADGIDFTITYNTFMKKVRQQDISSFNGTFDETPIKAKSRISFHGNFKEEVAQFFPPNTNFVSMEGHSKDIFSLLINQRYSQNPLSQPYLVDLLSCKNGCHAGSGTEKEYLKMEELYLKYIQQSHDKKKDEKEKSYEEKWHETCELFNNLEVHDFDANIPDLYKQQFTLSEEVYNEMFAILLKDTQAKRHIDCGSCGYKSCYEMAKAIAFGQNKKENCIHYMNDQMFINFFTDVQTGLLNVTSFMKNANELFNKNPDKSYVIFHGDINRFKVVNNLYGYLTGNEVLKIVAASLKNAVGKDGLCARLGGGTFCICMENLEDNIKRILDITNFDCKNLGIEFPITMRFGVYASNDTNMELTEMMNCATLCMDVNISTFQNTFTFYNDTYRKSKLQEVEITSKIQKALDNHEFSIWFQPQYKSNSGELVGAEVLCRWNNQNGKVIFPEVFIPIAEKNGFIKKIDMEVWKMAFSTMGKWIKNDVRLLPISINISRISLENDNFIYNIMNLARDYDVPPRLIHFEITETAYMDNPQNMINRINKLRNLGYKIAMDDFGSGYSSLNTLKDMPIDILKLDMGFLKEQSNMDKGGKIISSLAQMAQNLGYETIAEGVETQEQAYFLKGIGIDVIQGFLYSKPIQESKYLELLSSQQKVVEVETKETEQFQEINNFYNVNSNESFIFDKFLGPAAIFDFNQKNNKLQLLRVNQKALKICGLTNISNGRLMRFLKNFSSKESKEIFIETIKKSIKINSESVGFLKEKDFANNDQMYIKFHASPIYQKDDIYTIFILFEDITDELNKVSLISSSSKYLFDFISNSKDAISILHLQFDPMNINKKLNLKFLTVNTEFTNVTGYTQKDVNTLNGRQAFNFIHPIDRPNFIRKLLQAYYKDFENSPTLIFRFQKHNGKYIRVKILINGITQKDGSHILFTTFIEQNS
jgi:diguanylate cyclase (GGDEF)-like protein/PAS domain S-box-containing protein